MGVAGKLLRVRIKWFVTVCLFLQVTCAGAIRLLANVVKREFIKAALLTYQTLGEGGTEFVIVVPWPRLGYLLNPVI